MVIGKMRFPAFATVASKENAAQDRMMVAVYGAYGADASAWALAEAAQVLIRNGPLPP